MTDEGAAVYKGKLKSSKKKFKTTVSEMIYVDKTLVQIHTEFCTFFCIRT